MSDGRLLCNIVDAKLVLCVQQKVYNRLRPIRSVSKQTKITERFFRASQFAFFFTKFIRELDEELAVAVPLVLRKGQDTCDVVIISGFLLFREVSDNMASNGVALGLCFKVN